MTNLTKYLCRQRPNEVCFALFSQGLQRPSCKEDTHSNTWSIQVRCTPLTYTTTTSMDRENASNTPEAVS